MKQSIQDELTLGATSGPLLLERRHLIRQASRRMADQARRELLLFGRTLDPDLYDQRSFLMPCDASRSRARTCQCESCCSTLATPVNMDIV